MGNPQERPDRYELDPSAEWFFRVVDVIGAVASMLRSATPRARATQK